MELEGNSNFGASVAVLDQLRGRHHGLPNVVWENTPAGSVLLWGTIVGTLVGSHPTSKRNPPAIAERRCGNTCGPLKWI